MTIRQVWALDTTYIHMTRGFAYLTAVVDIDSRRVLAHKVAITLEACHASEVIISLGRMPPARFAELHRQRAGDAAQYPSTPKPIE